MKKILVVEDEDVIRDFTVLNLKRAGYEVYEAASGEIALEEFVRHPDIDIALLDIMLPGIDGLKVCQRLRAKNEALGIIMLSAKSQEVDKISGLMTGADDYMTKPFSPSELIARIDALSRRIDLSTKVRSGDSNTIRAGRFLVNFSSRMVYKNDEPIDLTQVEFQILAYFIENRGVALSRTDILNHVWGDNYFGEEKIVDVNVRRLRMKIEDNPSQPSIIATMWGLGYKWCEL